MTYHCTGLICCQLLVTLLTNNFTELKMEKILIIHDTYMHTNSSGKPPLVCICEGFSLPYEGRGDLDNIKFSHTLFESIQRH